MKETENNIRVRRWLLNCDIVPNFYRKSAVAAVSAKRLPTTAQQLNQSPIMHGAQMTTTRTPQWLTRAAGVGGWSPHGHYNQGRAVQPITLDDVSSEFFHYSTRVLISLVIPTLVGCVVQVATAPPARSACRFYRF